MPPRKPVSLELAMQGGSMGDPVQVAAPEPAPPPRSAMLEKLTVYVPRAAAKRLKQMALDNDKRVNDYLQEAVDMMLAKYGQPSLEEFENR